MATGVKALSIWMNETERLRSKCIMRNAKQRGLGTVKISAEIMNKGPHAADSREVGIVGQDERSGEKGTDRQYALDPSIPSHLNLIRSIDQGSRPLQNSRTDSRESQVEGSQEDGEGEFERREEVLVVQDDRDGTGHPDRDDDECWDGDLLRRRR